MVRKKMSREQCRLAGAQAIDSLVEFAGSPLELAKELGVTRTTVYLWRSGERRPGLDTCLEIEAYTGGQIGRRELWPEWFQ